MDHHSKTHGLSRLRQVLALRLDHRVMPIEDSGGPNGRTNVFVQCRADPIISRADRAS